MASNIDATKPVAGSPTTQSVRQNFAAAKSEIEALQSSKANKDAVFGKNYFSATQLGSIQAALDAANAANGGTVVVERGTWLITQALLIYSNTRLILENDTTIRRNANIDNMLRNGTAGATLYNGDSNIVVEGGVFDANGRNFPTNVCSLAFGHAKNVTVKNTTIFDSWGFHALEFNAVKDGVADNVIFDGLVGVDKELMQIDLMAGAAFYPWDTLFDNTPCLNIVAKNCIFKNGTRGIGSHSSRANFIHKNIKVIGCHFEDIAEEGVYGEDWSSVVISNNTFENNLRAIKLFNVTNTTQLFSIVGNTITGTQADECRAIWIEGISGGVRSENGVIANNTISNIGRHGIGVDYCNNWVIANNHCDNVFRTPIWLFYSNRCRVIGNSTSNVGAGNTPRRGIHVGSTATSPTSDDNIISGNNVEAIIIQFGARNLVTNNNVITLTNSGGATNRTIENFVNGTFVV